MTTVLVGYATAHGSTRSVAERLAARLAEAGARADVESLAAVQVERLAAYDAYVIGSAVHDMAWLPEAQRFVDAHAEALVRRPLWLYSVGLPAGLRGPGKAFAGPEETKIAGALVERLRPRGHRLFSGVIRPEHLSRHGRLRMKALGVRYGDYRDWAAVDGWAREIAGDLARADAA